MAFKNEEDFVDLIRSHFTLRPDMVPLGIGDDCAVIKCPSELCVSTDLFLENTHFRRNYFQPRDIGYKALAVNVSDICAMGAEPVGFSLGLSAPTDLPKMFWNDLFGGMAALANPLRLALTGGDFSRGNHIGMCVTIWGKACSEAGFITRTGAEPGDKLFITGKPGLARTGLMVLEKNPKMAVKYAAATMAHLCPMVQTDLACSLARWGHVKAMMDVSDGLAKDLPRMLGPDMGADITGLEDLLHPELIAFNGKEKALETAFSGGEDYFLLGAVAPELEQELQTRFAQVKIIGTVTEKKGLSLNGRFVAGSGYDHFNGEQK